jgi:hypothetical protein
VGLVLERGSDHEIQTLFGCGARRYDWHRFADAKIHGPVSDIIFSVAAFAGGHVCRFDRKTFDQLMSEAMSIMHRGMHTAEYTGDADHDFVTMMIPHHQGAIDMAKALLLYGKDPQMRRLAQEIITDQQSEIQLMQLWLKQHGRGS